MGEGDVYDSTNLLAFQGRSSFFSLVNDNIINTAKLVIPTKNIYVSTL